MSAEQKPFEQSQENLEGLEDSQMEENLPENSAGLGEEPASQTSEFDDGLSGIGSDESMSHYPARRRGRERGRDRSSRRGAAPSVLPTPETETSEAPEAENEAPKAVSEEPTQKPRRIYNQGTIPENTEQRILSAITTEATTTEPQAANPNSDAVDQAIAAYAQKYNKPAADPTERPNLSGETQSYRVDLGPTSQRNLELSRSRGEPATVAPETPKAPVKAEESAATPEPEPTAASTRTFDEEVRVTQPVALAAPAPRRVTPTTGGDLYAQLGLAENPLATDRSQLRGASRTGLEATGIPVLSSREIRDRDTPEQLPQTPMTAVGETTAEAPAKTSSETSTESTAELQARRRHARRGHPESLARRLRGYTSAGPEVQSAPANTDNEATQQLPVVTLGESNTGEAAPRLSRTQRLRAKLGSIASALENFGKNYEEDRELRRLGVMPSNPRPGIQPGMSKSERKLEKRRQEIEANADSETDQNFGIANVHLMSSEENAQRERSRGSRRRRMIGAIGLAAASAGLMSGVSGDLARDEAPRSSISASQLPGQQGERATEAPSLADRVREAKNDARERAQEAADAAEEVAEETAKPQTVDAGNEKITVGNDGSVTIELEKNGTYWEGVHEAERLLDIDDSATATANAVNTIGFENGEDRSQKVGSKVVFKNVNGKLVASRS